MRIRLVLSITTLIELIQRSRISPDSAAGPHPALSLLQCDRQKFAGEQRQGWD